MRAILSIDLGVDNLGYAVVSYNKHPMNKGIHEKIAFEDIDLEYGLYNIDAHVKKTHDVVLGRCTALQTFFNNIALKYVSIDAIIIERQVATNTCAMELMYAAASQALILTDNVVIFDPKLKFTKINVDYETKNKAHKRLSIQFAKQLLTNKFPENINLLDNSKKKDDMADAINQLFIWMIDNQVLNCSKDIYRGLIGL